MGCDKLAVHHLVIFTIIQWLFCFELTLYNASTWFSNFVQFYWEIVCGNVLIKKLPNVVMDKNMCLNFPNLFSAGLE